MREAAHYTGFYVGFFEGGKMIMCSYNQPM